MVGLTGIFIALLALTAALLGLGLTIDSGRWASFPALWRDEAMALLGLTVDGPAANAGSGVSQAIRMAQGLLGLILPALYIGAVVFRLFIHPDVFVFREKISLLPAPETFRGELDEDCHVLAIRVYNASRMRALDVRFNVVHQRWFGSGRDSVVRNIPLPLANATWPMADRPVPYTLFVPLKPGDVSEVSGKAALVTIRERPIGDRDRLVVHVSGAMPDVNETFIERHAFDLPGSVSSEPFGVIHLDYGEDPKTWDGWDGFDG
ncbi:MAG TPA: hypothetical protein VII45_09275 [Solirubrobacterales bacterium]